MSLALFLSADPPSGSTTFYVPPPARPEDRERERALIAQIRANDTNAFATLVDQYLDRVTRFATSIIGARDPAEDIVQSVFVQLWDQRASLDPDRPFKPYLYRIVRNRALDERKAITVRATYRAGVQADAIAGTIDASTPSPESAILTAAAIEAAVQQLPARRQQAIRLRFESQLSHAEIGEVLEISPQAAMQLVLRAIDDLRKKFGV